MSESRGKVSVMGSSVHHVQPHVTVWLSEYPLEPQPADILDQMAEDLRLACDEVAKRYICPEQGIDVMVL